MLRLKMDADFPTLGEKVILGRNAYRLLIWCKNNLLIEDASLREKFDQFDSTLYNDDVIYFDELIKSKKPVSTEDFFHEQYNMYLDGMDAGKRLIHFRGFFLTTENGSNDIPQDATSSERDPPSNPDKTAKHPSSKFEEIMRDINYCLQTDVKKDQYNDLVNVLQRHRHNMSYCWRDGKCRFGFPRKLSCESRLVVKDILGQRGENKGKVVRTNVEFVFKCNDGWVNSHSKFGLLAWAANMDMSLLIDRDSIVQYVAK